MKRILFNPFIIGLTSLLMLISCASPKLETQSTPPTQTQLQVQAQAAQPPKEVDPKVFNAPVTTEKAEFIPHMEEKPMKAYLSMNLPYAHYQALFEQLQKAEGIVLVNRGEAHITVITPLEYDKVLKKHLDIAEIHKIAEAARIQEFEFIPLCIGKGQKVLNGKIEKTYFMVVESPALTDLRGQIEEAYIKNGGKPQEFIPERFAPHVTLGYTIRDLHAEDGVLKNKASCLYQFKKN